MIGSSSLGELSSNQQEGEEDIVSVHLKGPMCRIGKNAQLFLTLLICFIILSILFVIVWMLETHHPVHSFMPTTIPPPEHEYFTLPPHLIAHRENYRENRFVQILAKTHIATNKTECWVCGLLPSAHHQGASFIPISFSYNGSCLAWYRLAVARHHATMRVGRMQAREMRGNIFGTCKFEYGTMIRGTEMEQMEFAHFATSVRVTRFQHRNVTVDREIPIEVYSTNVSFCVHSKGEVEVGHSLCRTIIDITSDYTPSFISSKNTYFVCGDKAYVWLPEKWSGTCYIAFLLLPTYIAPPDYHRTHRIRRREIDQTDTAGQQFVDVMKGIIPFWGPITNSLQIRRLSRVLESVVNITGDIIANMSVEMQANRLVTLQNRMVLDLLLAEKGGVCHLIGSSCCVYIPNSAPNVHLAIQKLHRISADLHIENGTWTWSGWLGSLLVQWGWKLLMILLVIGGLFLCCCCCVQCCPLCISSCFLSCRSAFGSTIMDKAMIAQQREIERFCKLSPDLFDEYSVDYE